MIREVSSRLACSFCNYGFEYSSTILNMDVEKVLDFFKIHLGTCPHCKTGHIRVVKAKYKMYTSNKPKEQKYEITWRCTHCGETWIKIEYVNEKELVGKNLIVYFEEKALTYCPNIGCTGQGKKIMKISKRNIRSY